MLLLIINRIVSLQAHTTGPANYGRQILSSFQTKACFAALSVYRHTSINLMVLIPVIIIIYMKIMIGYCF